MDLEASRVELRLAGLDRALRGLWRLGGNALVGWRPSPAGIAVIVCPIGVLFAQANAHRRVFVGDRLMGLGTFNKLAGALGVAPVDVPLPKPVGAGPGTIATAAVERCVARYAVVRTDQRAVFLIDIAGFSLLSPEEQAAQLATLGYAINLAEARTTERGLPVDLARSTTGDGYYLWNRRKGRDADTALFALFALALAAHARLQPTLSPTGAPAIRSAFGIGSHYTYHQRDGSADMAHDYIVGDVTIRLARLIEGAARNQILFADFAHGNRGEGDAVDPRAFIERADEATIAPLAGVEIGGAVVERIAVYLTGPRSDDGTFGVRRLSIVDKHGRHHVACNAKVNVVLRNSPPLFLGLQDFEVAGSATPSRQNTALRQATG